MLERNKKERKRRINDYACTPLLRLLSDSTGLARRKGNRQTAAGISANSTMGSGHGTHGTCHEKTGLASVGTKEEGHEGDVRNEGLGGCPASFSAGTAAKYNSTMAKHKNKRKG